MKNITVSFRLYSSRVLPGGVISLVWAYGVFVYSPCNSHRFDLIERLNGQVIYGLWWTN